MRNAHVAPVLAEIVNAASPSVPPICFEDCAQCGGRGFVRGRDVFAEFADCTNCAGNGYIVTEAAS